MSGALDGSCLHAIILQAQAIVKAKELMVHKLPDRMDTHFSRLLEFQIKNEAVVKQRVVEAVMACMEAVPRLDFLTAATGCVRNLLNDAFSSVVKAALAGTKSLMLVSLHTFCYATPHQRQEAVALWGALNGVLDTIIESLVSHQNPGIRLMTFKLLEQISLMVSSSHCPSVKGVCPLMPALPHGAVQVVLASGAVLYLLRGSVRLSRA